MAVLRPYGINFPFNWSEWNICPTRFIVCKHILMNTAMKDCFLDAKRQSRNQSINNDTKTTACTKLLLIRL
jgi:hypothetical protein